LSSYRRARKAIMASYRDGDEVARWEAMTVLRTELHMIIAESTVEAAKIGQESAIRQAGYYTVAGVDLGPAGIGEVPFDASTGWVATVDGQLNGVQALMAADADPALIYGDEYRLGALQPAPINRDGTKWLAMASIIAFLLWLFGRKDGDGNYRLPPDLEIKKQAIAHIDNKTTNCCLRVHGQIQEIDDRFVLRGTPRYADRMDAPPFHTWCRTALALYIKEFDLDLTAVMLEDARAELARRKA